MGGLGYMEGSVGLDGEVLCYMLMCWVTWWGVGLI